MYVCVCVWFSFIWLGSLTRTHDDKCCRTEITSRGKTRAGGTGTGGAAATINGNPNDEQVTDTVSIWGKGPGPRAGHSATLLDRRLIIFGGSHGTKYLG